MHARTNPLRLSLLMGAEVLRGDLDDLDSLRRGAAASDGVIHTAFMHGFTDFAKAAEADRCAIEAIGAVLAGSDRPFVVAAGTPGLVEGRVVTEDEKFCCFSPAFLGGCGAAVDLASGYACRSYGCLGRCTARVTTTVLSHN